MHPLSQSGKTDFKARALLVGERIDLRSLSTSDRLATDPVAIAAGANGIAVLFRYGAVVLFNVAPLEETDLLRQLRPLVQQPYASPETESLEIHIDAGTREGMTGNTLDPGRLRHRTLSTRGRYPQQEHRAGHVRGPGEPQLRPGRTVRRQPAKGLRGARAPAANCCNKSAWPC